jgi:formate-dependent nitrite reductase cytochrome c552 subunit
MNPQRTSVLLAGTLAFFVAAGAFAETPHFVGSQKCKGCHLREYRSWEKTRMAKTLDLLRPGVDVAAKRKARIDPKKDYTRETKCLGCHVTGYGKPGGFVDVAHTPELAGVQCEECHGPASEYLKEGGMTLANKTYKRADLVKLGLVVPNREACAVCHSDKSPFRGPGFAFRFEEREKRGAHEFFPLKSEH